MPKLTAVAVAKYKATAARREIRDTQAPGLYLIIQPPPSGAKSWAVRFRRPDGKPAKLTLGSVRTLAEGEKEPTEEPEIGGWLTLRQAHRLAHKIDGRRAGGIDVVAEYQTDKHRKKTASQDQATFGAALLEFVVDHRTKWHARPRRWRADARLLGLDYPIDCEDPKKVQPTVIVGSLADTWRDKPLTTIDGHDVHTVVDQARKLGIPGLDRRNDGTSEARGRKVHAALSVFFRWALRQRRVAVNPCIGVWHPGAPPSRERVLTDAETVAFWRGCEKIGWPFGPLFQLCLLTAARLGEVTALKQSELSDDGKFWTIPTTRTKNHRKHELPLSNEVQAILSSLPRVQSEDGLLFTTTGTRPVSGFSRSKMLLDEAMNAAAGKPIEEWRLHDLRRTVASGMQRLRVRSEVIERVLNHVAGGVRGIYQRDPMTEEVAEALQRWATHVRGLVDGKPTTNVTTFRRKEAQP